MKKHTVTGLARLAIVAVTLVIIGVFVIRFISYKSNVENIYVSAIDLSAVRDGEYEGASDADFVKANVKVTVRQGVITGIVILTHDSAEMGKKAESVIDAVVARQALEVDTISGAIASS